MRLAKPLFLLAALGTQHVAAQKGCCSAWFKAPEGAIVKDFGSITYTPAFPKGKGVHFIWSGLENRNGSFVFQTVLASASGEGTGNKTWTAAIGDYHEFKSNPTRRGDSFGNELLLGDDDEPNGHMVGEWVVQPGAEGKAMGDEGQNNTATIDINGKDPLTNFIFEIELQQGATWNFGPQTWTRIFMEVNSTDTTWCTKPTLGQHKFKYSMSDPHIEVGEGSDSSMCIIDYLTFDAP
ncbi:hypothetical protein B0J14DRAFT_689188 [Halenospora varia]|nr:hypothetical protein B0J14DRAFT_689188 [Halenospora varia]